MSDLETVARWLGFPFTVYEGSIGVFDSQVGGFTFDPLDKDQELGAIWRKAVTDGCEPAMRWDAEERIAYFSLLDRDGMLRYGLGLLPHLAARAAVCKLVGEAK